MESKVFSTYWYHPSMKLMTAWLTTHCIYIPMQQTDVTWKQNTLLYCCPNDASVLLFLFSWSLIKSLMKMGRNNLHFYTVCKVHCRLVLHQYSNESGHLPDAIAGQQDVSEGRCMCQCTGWVWVVAAQSHSAGGAGQGSLSMADGQHSVYCSQPWGVLVCPPQWAPELGQPAVERVHPSQHICCECKHSGSLLFNHTSKCFTVTSYSFCVFITNKQTELPTQLLTDPLTQ